jgi:hypothetical protein
MHAAYCHRALLAEWQELVIRNTLHAALAAKYGTDECTWCPTGHCTGCRTTMMDITANSIEGLFMGRHSLRQWWLGIDCGPQASRMTHAAKERLRTALVLIIDEYSLLPDDLLDKLDESPQVGDD